MFHIHTFATHLIFHGEPLLRVIGNRRGAGVSPFFSAAAPPSAIVPHSVIARSAATWQSVFPYRPPPSLRGAIATWQSLAVTSVQRLPHQSADWFAMTRVVPAGWVAMTRVVPADWFAMTMDGHRDVGRPPHSAIVPHSVIARSAATWQSVFPYRRCIDCHTSLRTGSQ
jgi:hypothetical protein